MINWNVDIYKEGNKYLNIFNPPRRKSCEQKINVGKILNNNNNNNNKGESLAKSIKKKKRKKKKTKTIITKKVKIDLDKVNKSNLNDNSKNKINDLSKVKYMQKKITHKKKDKNKNKNGIEIKEKLDNFELNELDFQEAIKFDNRTFIQIYWGILKREHPILFNFFAFDDYNLIYIKLARFIFLVSTDMVMNVFFISDESMHKLYVDYGKYNLIQ